MQHSRRPILITGSHRSGTTWVGRMIAKSPEIAYIHEPFNIENTRPGISGGKFANWFQYITFENETLYYPSIKSTLEYRYALVAELTAIKSFVDIARLIRDYSKFLYFKLKKKRPLIKDPIAIFSAEWLAQSFGMQVIVMIRHPAAFISSLKRKNWQFDFNHFLQQPLLMRDHLSLFEDQIRTYAAHPPDIIDQASLLWKIIHHVIFCYQQSHPEWLFLKHEDLSRDPILYFEYVFDYLQLRFDQKIKETIIEYSSSQNPKDVQDSQESLRRDSKANILNWKKRLTKLEISRIYANTNEISRLFYSEKDW